MFIYRHILFTGAKVVISFEITKLLNDLFQYYFETPAEWQEPLKHDNAAESFLSVTPLQCDS